MLPFSSRDYVLVLHKASDPERRAVLCSHPFATDIPFSRASRFHRASIASHRSIQHHLHPCPSRLGGRLIPLDYSQRVDNLLGKVATFDDFVMHLNKQPRRVPDRLLPAGSCHLLQQRLYSTQTLPQPFRQEDGFLGCFYCWFSMLLRVHGRKQYGDVYSPAQRYHFPCRCAILSSLWR